MWQLSVPGHQNKSALPLVLSICDSAPTLRNQDSNRNGPNGHQNLTWCFIESTESASYQMTEPHFPTAVWPCFILYFTVYPVTLGLVFWATCSALQEMAHLETALNLSEKVFSIFHLLEKTNLFENQDYRSLRRDNKSAPWQGQCQVKDLDRKDCSYRGLYSAHFKI